MKDRMGQASPTPFRKGRGRGGMVEGAGEVVGNGAGNLEAPSWPESGALPLPQAPRTWRAKGAVIGPWRPGCMRAGVEAKKRELFSRAGLRRGDRDLPGFGFPCQM